jgi:hypothetical protein
MWMADYSPRTLGRQIELRAREGKSPMALCTGPDFEPQSDYAL